MRKANRRNKRAGRKLLRMFKQIESIPSYFLLQRTTKTANIFDTELVWKCRCAAPQDFESVSTSIVEAVSNAIETHKTLTKKD